MIQVGMTSRLPNFQGRCRYHYLESAWMKHKGLREVLGGFLAFIVVLSTSQPEPFR